MQAPLDMVAVIQWRLVRILPMASGLSMRLLSSTWRELKAVSLVLNSFTSKLAGHRVTGLSGLLTIKMLSVSCKWEAKGSTCSP